MEILKRCKHCGSTFIAHKMNTLYCSPSCNWQDYKQRKRQEKLTEYYADHPEKETEPRGRTKSDGLDQKAFLTPREAAKLLGIGKSSVYRELANGLIKAVQMRGKTLIRRKDIDRLFDNAPEYKSKAGEKKHEKREKSRQMGHLSSWTHFFRARFFISSNT